MTPPPSPQRCNQPHPHPPQLLFYCIVKYTGAAPANRRHCVCVIAPASQQLLQPRVLSAESSLSISLLCLRLFYLLLFALCPPVSVCLPACVYIRSGKPLSPADGRKKETAKKQKEKLRVEKRETRQQHLQSGHAHQHQAPAGA